MARAEGHVTPWATGGRRGPKQRPTAGANQILLGLRRNPVATSKAPSGKEKIQKVSRRPLEVQESFWPRRDDLITSRDGARPHHRSKDTAP